jgi:putative endonuclease
VRAKLGNMSRTLSPCVYILSNINHSVFYTGFTTNLAERMAQHKSGAVKGFTEKYKTTKLLYVEHCDTIEQGVHREKLVKKWSRTIKFERITALNPTWQDLSNAWL